MSVISKSFPYGPHSVTIETGELARRVLGGRALDCIDDTAAEAARAGVDHGVLSGGDRALRIIEYDARGPA